MNVIFQKSVRCLLYRNLTHHRRECDGCFARLLDGTFAWKGKRLDHELKKLKGSQLTLRSAVTPHFHYAVMHPTHIHERAHGLQRICTA